jgi:four helix bundle protein
MDDGFESFELNEQDKPYSIKHRCYYFSENVVLFVKECRVERVFSSLFDQLIGSATSIGANIIEGKSGSSKKRLEELLCYCSKIFERN